MPSATKAVHLGQRRVVDVVDHHVEAVVDGAAALGPRHPGLQALAQGTAPRLAGEVDDGRGAAEGCGPGARLEGVPRDGASDGQLHVRVGVDAARDDEPPASIDDAVHFARRQDRQWLVGRCGTLRESHGRDRLVRRRGRRPGRSRRR